MRLEEHHEYLCGILAKLVDVLTCDELQDLASALGVRIAEFYCEEPIEAIEWNRKEAA